MNPKLVDLFKSRWEQVKRIEQIELQQTSPQEKFCHLTQILRFDGELGFDWQNNKEDRR